MAEQITMEDVYKIRIGGVVADPYRIARAYGLDPVITQAVKKLLRSGRKHKMMAEDVREAITTLLRWEEMEQEDNNESNEIPTTGNYGAGFASM